MNRKTYNEISKQIAELEEKIKNGGAGSGNFGHAGRPGERGGSAPSGVSVPYGITEGSGLSKDEEDALRELLTDRKSSYGGDVVETTKQVLKDHAWDMEGISEGILLAYEDEARSRAGVPSRDEELGGVGVSYGEMSAVQGELDAIIDSKSLSELTKDIGIVDMASAIQIAQDINCEKYARKMAEQMGEYSKKSDLEKFAKAALPYRYDEILDKVKDESDVRQGWIDAADRLKDSLDFQFDNSASDKTVNGGRGSGNFGHAGRPGERGGSAPSDSFRAGDTYEKDGEKMTVEEGKHGLEGVSDDGRVISEVPSKEATKRDKKILEELEDKIKDNITKVSQAAVALKEGKVKDEAETRQYIEQLHEERQELRERLARVKTRIEGYEQALMIKADEKKIDKILGTEKIKQGSDKKTDDANFKKLAKDVREIQRVLAKEKSRENFGQDALRKLKDKYSDYMSGNWSVVGRFQGLLRYFDDWASDYEHNSFIPRPEELDKVINGGKGSGNFGHAGRPGERGGSAPMGTSTSGKTLVGLEAYKAIGESQKRAEKQEMIVKDFERAAKRLDELQDLVKLAKAGKSSNYKLIEKLYEAQEAVTYLYEHDLKKADAKDRSAYDKEQRELALEVFRLTKHREPQETPPSRDDDIMFWLKDNSIDDSLKVYNGGAGSGNFGHAGRPGKVGGSSSDGAVEARAKAEAEYDKTHPEATQADIDEFRARVSKKDDTGVEKISDKRAYDHLRNNYDELGFGDSSTVDTDFVNDKAMTILTSLNERDILDVVKSKLVADDIYYSMAGNINKYYKEGRDNPANLAAYMNHSQHYLNDAVNGVVTMARNIAIDSTRNYDDATAKTARDVRATSYDSIKETLGEVEKRLARHEDDSEGFKNFAKDTRKQIEKLQKASDKLKEISERVHEAPIKDQIIQDVTKKNSISRKNFNEIAKRINELEKRILNGGRGSGNFGHAGRPGEIGGSAPSGSSASVTGGPLMIPAEIASKILDYTIGASDARDFYEDAMAEHAYTVEEADKEAAKKLGADLEDSAIPQNDRRDFWYAVSQQLDDKAHKLQDDYENTQIVAKIDEEYKKRGKEMDKISDKIQDAVNEKSTYTGTKEEALDFLKSNIHYNKDNFGEDEFMEETEPLLDDLKFVEKMTAKKVRIDENPMSASNVVFTEVKK